MAPPKPDARHQAMRQNTNWRARIPTRGATYSLIAPTPEAPSVPMTDATKKQQDIEMFLLHKKEQERMAQGRTPRGPLIAPYQYSVVPGHRIYPASVPPFIPSQVEMNMNAEKTQTRAPRSLSYNPEQVPAPSVDYKKAPSAPKYPFTPRQVEINMNAERAQKERAIRAQEELAIEAQEEREMGGPPSSPELSPVRPAGHTQAPRPPEYPSIPSLARMGVLPPNTSLHLTKQDVSTLVSANPSAGRPAPPAQAFGIDRAPITSRVTSRTTVPSMLRENSLTTPPSSRQSQPLRTPHPAYDSFGTNLYESGTARIGQSTIYYNSQEYTWDEIQQALANAQEYGQATLRYGGE